MFDLEAKIEDTPYCSNAPRLNMDGIFDIIKRKDGMVCRFYGGWDKEQAMAFSASFQACIKSDYQFKKWSIIKDIENWQQVSDEAIEVLEDLISWAEENGQIANAYLYKGELDFQTFSSLSAKEYLSKIHYREFISVTTAIVWLNKLGFNLASPSA